MKKVLSFVGCALFVAAMTVSCKNNQEATADTLVEDTTVMNAVEEVAEVSEDTVAVEDAAVEAEAVANQQ
ncbi:MAG: hypothetical protein K6F72_07565 [Bacteroidales bacterium]|nr:hypothetical protein [Bacteroidales bacterium]